jgi:DNA repair photolyase
MKTFGSPFRSTSGRVYNTWCRYTDRIDTYGQGCQHDCSYCYAKSLLSFRGYWNPEKPMTSNLVDIKSIVQKLPRDRVIRMGGMTDCFQPLEKTRRTTYQTIKFMNYYRISYLIVTKGAMVADPEYLEIYDKQLAHFQVTITCTDDTKSRTYEKASPPSERIKAVEKLQSSGFDVSVRLSPFIPENIDLTIINLISCDKILIEFLKVNHNIKKWFDVDFSHHTHKYGGYLNLELDRKIELVSKIIGFDQLSVGEYVKEHHQYFSQNVNFNPLDCCNLTNNRVFLKTKQLTLFI